ncbi:hypothetical protein HDF26_002441 [Pedobacter cryoconitis]|uniref:DUF4833 domain-containing protein n=1 Tax=Pedobacter cryoconitis TaxID=188932 RepID=UPI0016081C62|nr:DUF4833 domain-containing protein [Pedobacter cryoconitis]MBB6271984.1 hypothetical protein [Pedobacter cryoconitis]
MIPFKKAHQTLQIVSLVLLTIGNPLSAQPFTTKEPPAVRIENLLFFIQKSPDANTVVYELNLNEDGTLCTQDPVKVSWIRYAEDGKREELTSIERKHVYGVQSQDLGNDEYEIHLMAYTKLPLYLRRSQTDNKYKIYIKDEGLPYLLKRAFIKLDRCSFWYPKVRYIDLVAVDTANGKEILRRINI